ncbi:uncharacterized protein EV422DRAFT_342009 [Fimicolochytrium jonesii]|uniref:uncharacterized protein n=1 Tax=Fimicolochytrium jonesii TaxID=1396493 RepID=UPI0022FF39D3|nr:uncharacterized protein EV422DRAFT_342009 [Fimicolochytrium jonesii]KAI8815826.1 hypothetical protein EV422DRAFT_342009 [Fimicolochytrium jonesii]
MSAHVDAMSDQDSSDEGSVCFLYAKEPGDREPTPRCSHPEAFGYLVEGWDDLRLDTELIDALLRFGDKIRNLMAHTYECRQNSRTAAAGTNDEEICKLLKLFIKAVESFASMSPKWFKRVHIDLTDESKNRQFFGVLEESKDTIGQYLTAKDPATVQDCVGILLAIFGRPPRYASDHSPESNEPLRLQAQRAFAELLQICFYLRSYAALLDLKDVHRGLQKSIRLCYWNAICNRAQLTQKLKLSDYDDELGQSLQAIKADYAEVLVEWDTTKTNINFENEKVVLEETSFAALMRPPHWSRVPDLGKFASVQLEQAKLAAKLIQERLPKPLSGTSSTTLSTTPERGDVDQDEDDDNQFVCEVDKNLAHKVDEKGRSPRIPRYSQDAAKWQDENLLETFGSREEGQKT